MISSISPTVWIEVDLGAIRHNLRQVRNLIGDVKMLAVVKANAYGHGMVPVARAVMDEGACCLGVTRIEDALELRGSGITAPILVFGSSLPEYASAIVDSDLEQTVCTLDLARALSAAAQASGRTAKVHVKVDTGMGRLGVSPADVPAFVQAVAALPGVQIAGVYTHFATAADKDNVGAHRQLNIFDKVLADLRSQGIVYGAAHAAASAAILCLPGSYYDMVRPGTLLYGQYPSSHVPKALDLRETWKLKTRISFIHDVAKGTSIGYGAEYVTRRPSRIVILSAGYADGLGVSPESVFRRNSLLKALRNGILGWPTPLVTIQGKRAPIVGRIAMEMCAVDVTDLPGAEVGDEVTLPCRRISADSRIHRIYK